MRYFCYVWGKRIVIIEKECLLKLLEIKFKWICYMFEEYIVLVYNYK